MSFAAQTRVYASGAIGHQNQGKPGAFSYMKRFLGADARDAKEDITQITGMDKMFYDFGVKVNETRGTYEFITDEKGTSMPVELVFANIIQHAKGK